jgi:hypothetical protein
MNNHGGGLTIKTLLSGFTVLASSVLQAQGRWSLELRPAIAYANQSLEELNLGTGNGLEGTVAYQFSPYLAAYAGFGGTRFPAEQAMTSSGVNLLETGYTYGFQFVYPVGESDLSYIVRAGRAYSQIETENHDGDISADSGHGFCLQAIGGFVAPINEQSQMVPTVRFRSLPRGIRGSEVASDIDLNYISVGIGVCLSF